MNTTHFLNRVMGNVFNVNTNPGLPTNYYIGLSTSAPNVSGGNVTEPTGGNYARVRLSSLAASGTAGVVTNNAAVSFSESSAAWGTMTHFVIFDASTGGNLLMYDTLSTARAVEANTIVTIKTNSLTLTLSNPT